MKNKLLIAVACSLFLFGCDSSQQPHVKKALPEPESAGAKVFGKFCGDCHAPPRIKSHKPDEWRNIINRMQNHRLKKAYHLLSDSEVETLLAYLKKHST